MAATNRLSLLALPSEILDNIALLLYSDGNDTVKSIKDLSRTCKLFREIIVPILFHTKSLAISAELYNLQRLLVATDLQWHRHVNTLILTSDAGFSTLTSQHVTLMCQCLRQLFGMFTGLRTLRLVHSIDEAYAAYPVAPFRLDAAHTTPPLGLSSLRERSLHVILNLRNGGVGFDVRKWEPFFAIPNWRWSISAPKYQEDIAVSKDEQPLQLISFKRDLCLETPNKDSWLRIAKHQQGLEELQLVDKQTEIALGEFPTIKPQVRKILQRTSSIQRLRIEGSILAWHLIPDILNLNRLQHLTIYSAWRIAFHRTCTDDIVTPTTDLPWLSLPNLRYLDIRFICHHFSIQQMVPPGLLGLRIEFFDAKGFLTVSDIHWLQKWCPHLERLELDIGNFFSRTLGEAQIPEDTADRLDALVGFRHLRVLRFFPTYWDNGKLLRHPLKSKCWPVTLFARLQKQVTSLRQLHICMSYGEYPFDAVPRTFDENRPLKFRVLKANQSEYILRYSFAYSGFATDITFQGSINNFIGSKPVFVRLDDFFEDLDHDWVIPHADFVGSHQKVDEDEG